MLKMETNDKIPNHVAIILDGNGRWAKQRGLKRSLGHKAGAENLKKLSEYIFKKGVKILSVFAFSTENFKRDKEEVDYLMNLFVKEVKKFVNKTLNVKIVFSGRRTNLPQDVLKTMDEVEEKTKNNTDYLLNICINYGGRADIIDATKKIAIDYQNNKISLDDLTEETFIKYLYNGIPDIDLLIRTSGEIRISNFMLYQSAYAEMYFPSDLFPDFKEGAFDIALEEYAKRNRKFGGVKDDQKNN